MEVEKSFFQSVVSLVYTHRQFDNYELEARYTLDISRDSFDRCVSYYQSDEDYDVIVEDDNLDIIVHGTDYRVSIHGKTAIADYCETNTIDENNVIVITKTAKSKLDFAEIDFRINLKQEAKQDNTVLDKLFLMEKSYRFKKRYSYLHRKDGIRIDLTIVKKAMGAYKNFKESRITAKPEHYEIEIEVVNKIKEPDVVATTFLNYMLNMYSLINDEDYVCLKSDKKAALNEYFKLFYGSIPSDYEKQPRMYFAGPQPVTLERKNVVPAKLGTTSIREDYTVTEKADGERQLMFVSASGSVWLINSRLTIRYTGVKLSSTRTSIFDGELITNNLIGEPVKQYAIFDCYWYNGDDVRTLPLVGKDKSRLSKAENFIKICGKSLKDVDCDVFVKDFLFGSSIFDKCADILKKRDLKQFPYKIDGLIFTPMYLPVGASFMDDKIIKPVGTWEMVFKWKPPEDNTIDFLAKFRKGSSNNPLITFINSQAHRVIDLYVGYNPAKWDKITARKFLEGNIIRKNSYVARSFVPPGSTEPAISYINLKCVCENGDLIEDDSIVEFKYEGEEWLPIRVRKDKTEMYRKTSSISGAVNDIKSALNVWNSISVPITESHIIGKEIPEVPDEEDVYYDRKVDRKRFASKGILDFHNKDIKDALLREYKGEFMLDLACGKGGDVGKYLKIGYKQVFGMDSNRDNIENPIDGVYARLLDNREFDAKSMRYVFITADLSQKVTLNSFTDGDDKHVASVLWGTTKDMKLHKYEGMASQKKADVVSCQFAIHYFYKDKRTLENFIYNVDSNIREGGHFIGTCLDGYEVKKILNGKMVAEGIVNKRVLWSISRHYEKEKGVDFGEQIEVFMESIGRVFKEYLVNIDMLEKLLKPLGYELVSKKNFREYYNEERLPLTDTEKMYSFLNIAFVFRKSGPKAPVRKLTKKVPIDVK